MKLNPGATLTDAGGHRALLEPGGDSDVIARLEDGSRLMLPLSLLIERDPENYFLPLSLAELGRVGRMDAPAEGPRVIPVVQEELVIHKRQQETARVKIHKHVEYGEQLINEPVMVEEIEVRHVPSGRFVTEPVPVRQEGDTMIVTLLEEVVVVEKRLRVREELHITKRAIEQRHPQTIPLRRESVSIERIDPTPGSDTTGQAA